MQDQIQIKKAVCTWCKGECGIDVHVRDGRLVKLEEDRSFERKVWPPTKSCVRFQTAGEYFHHPDRVNFPLKRVGERGQGKWQQIPWEQAFDEIAGKMQQIADQYGWEAVSWSHGTGYRTDVPIPPRFFSCIGAPNNCKQGQICYLPRSKVANAIAGYFSHYSVRPQTRCIVMLGVDPLVGRPITTQSIREARKLGAKIIVIDPRRTSAAEMADIWLQVRPGSDVALLLGMTHVLIAENLYDKDFVDNWCHGFDQLKEHVRDYPPEKVESITWIPAEKIKEAARLYAANRPACFIEGMGVEHLQSSAQVLHARWIMAGLTANIDVQGGDEQVGQFPGVRSSVEVVPAAKMPPEQGRKAIGADRFKLLTAPTAQLMNEYAQRVWGRAHEPLLAAHAPSVYRAMITGKPYPVRAMYTVASNPMVTQANTKLVYKALKSLDLYVVADFFMTPSAELADYVLAPACWLERPMLWDFAGHANYLIAGEAALPKSIPGEYDHRVDYDIFRQLAIRLGKGEYFPWADLEAYYDHILEGTGLTHHEFVHQRRCVLKEQKYKKYEDQGFATATGKVELYSTLFEKLGYDPLPHYREPAETPVSDPVSARQYPYRLITGGRVRPYYHSEQRQIDTIRRMRPDPIVQIHPDTAAAHGIVEGDWVWIETKRGRIKQKAQVFDGLDPSVIHTEHGWWYPELPGEEPWLHGVWISNANVLLNDDPDVCNEIIGGWPLKTALCKIYKEKVY
ncbi:MAG: molybdopterin-dependent oxidoreductase [Desulfobacterales bacterium]|nr:molybdopterin-dependent oxidoreductase [Desulfobacterales bacterium]